MSRPSPAPTRFPPAAATSARCRPLRCRAMTEAGVSYRESFQMNNKLRSPVRLTGLLMALVLAGCASVPAIDPAGLPATPVAFKEAGGRFVSVAPADAQPRGAWWKVFADPV